MTTSTRICVFQMTIHQYNHVIANYFKKSLDHLRETFRNLPLEYIFLVRNSTFVDNFRKVIVSGTWNLNQFVGYFCPLKLNNKKRKNKAYNPYIYIEKTNWQPAS